MSYLEREGGYKGVTYGVGAMAVLGIAVLLRTCARFGGAMAMTTPEAAAQQLLTDPQGQQVFQAMQRTYPQEFTELSRMVATRVSAGSDDRTLGRSVATFLIDARRRHKADLLQAPHEALAEYRRAEIAMVEALRDAGTDLCARYAVAGRVDIVGKGVPLSVTTNLQRAAWEASAAGREQPANRGIQQPSVGTFRTVSSGMRARGLSAAEVTTYLDPPRFAAAPDALKCRAHLAFLETVHELPGTDGDTLYAYLLAQSG